MRLILEKEEIVRILGKHFDAELDPVKVVIRTEPDLEIEVSGIPLTLNDPAPVQRSNVVPLPTKVGRAISPPLGDEVDLAHQRDDDTYSEPPPEGVDGFEVSDEGGISPHAVLAKSRELQAKLDRDNPQLGKRRGGNNRPPGDFSNEIE